jgi:hypothetical protein
MCPCSCVRASGIRRVSNVAGEACASFPVWLRVARRTGRFPDVSPRVCAMLSTLGNTD